MLCTETNIHPCSENQHKDYFHKKWPFKVGLTWCVSFVLALCTAANCMLRRQGLSFAYDKCPLAAPSPPAPPNTHLFMCTSGSRALHHTRAPELFKTRWFKVKCMVKSSPKRQVTPAYCLGSGQPFLSWKSQKGGRQATGTPELLSVQAVWIKEKTKREKKAKGRNVWFECLSFQPLQANTLPSAKGRKIRKPPANLSCGLVIASDMDLYLLLLRNKPN